MPNNEEIESRDEFLRLLVQSGFTGVRLNTIPLPEHVIAFALDDFASDDTEAKQAERDELTDTDGLTYYAATTDQGTFGVFFAASMPIIDLTGSTVTPAAYLHGREHSFGAYAFVSSGTPEDLHRLATLLADANPGSPQPNTIPAPAEEIADTAPPVDFSVDNIYDDEDTNPDDPDYYD